MSRVQVTKCVKIPSETCRDVPVAHCKAVPTRTAVLRSVKVTTDDNVTLDEYSCDCNNIMCCGLQECQRCESYEDFEVDIEYEKNCQRLEKENCKTEYTEVIIIIIINNRCTQKSPSVKECHYEDTDKCEVEYKDQCEVTYAYGKQCTKVPVPNCSTVKVALCSILY